VPIIYISSKQDFCQYVIFAKSVLKCFYPLTVAPVPMIVDLSFLSESFPYTTFLDKDYIISRIDKLDFTEPKRPIGYPLTKDCWHVYIDNQWIPVKSIPAGTLVLDVESVFANKMLALASGYHLEHKRWFAYFASGRKNLPIEDFSLIIAHRVCFEMSFIANSYKHKINIKGICTHVMTSLYLHPLKEALIRSHPHIPYFKESSALDLASLYYNFTGVKPDKGFVEIFIDSGQYDWLDLNFANRTMEKVHKKAVNKINKINKKDNTNLPYPDLKIFKDEEHIDSAFQYNYSDVIYTITVFYHAFKNYREQHEYVFLGFIEISTPIIYLDDNWYSHINHIEYWYQDRLAKLSKLAKNLQLNHIAENNNYDGQDWKLWTKAAKGGKAGLPKWYEPKDISITKKSTAICLKLAWNGKYLKRIITTHPDKGNEIALWHTITPNEGETYEQAMLNESNAELFNNPTSISKDFKNIVSFFSKKFLPYWQAKILTSNSTIGEEAVSNFVETTFWTSIRKRIFGLKIYESPNGLKITIPRPTLAGAISGRGIDKIFKVLCKWAKDKAGSEIQALVKAPKGLTIIRFDLDGIQLRAFATLCDAVYARRKGKRDVELMATEFSKAAILGRKETKTTVAHLIAQRAGYDLSDPISAKKGYEVGKTGQFAGIFGCSPTKLSSITGLPLSGSESLLNVYRGEKDRFGHYSGGIASDGFNGQNYLSQGLFPNKGLWRKNKYMKSLVLGRNLPKILSPDISGKEFYTSKNCVPIQSSDVDFKLIIAVESARAAMREGITLRWAYDVHDEFDWFIRTKDEKPVRDILNNAHRKAYELFFDTWNVDLNTVPDFMWYPESIDCSPRWLKKLSDVEDMKTPTMYSFDEVETGIYSEEDSDDSDDDMSEEDEAIFDFD
jgi:hypothetical protein